MSLNRRNARHGFTLLELLIVLAILAVMTMLATREIAHVEDQRRYEISQRGLEEIETAILGFSRGVPSDLSANYAGFVGDMGRLPRAQLSADGTTLTLSELWEHPKDVLGHPKDVFDLRRATEDPEVLVPGGWRGPYIRLPLGADNLRDGWGNPYTTPAAVGDPIYLVRHLGADGIIDDGTTKGYDRDFKVSFTNEVQAGVYGIVQVWETNMVRSTDAIAVEVRVFGPDATDAKIIKVKTKIVTNAISWQIPLSEGITPGPRVIRAYCDSIGKNSAIQYITLRPGMNQVNLDIFK